MTATETLTAKDIQKRLAEPFDPYDIEWRVGQARVYEEKGQQKVFAKVLAYVTNRAIMHRLDEVVGIGNWTNEYRPWHAAKSGPSQICRLSVRIGGEWIAKEDGAECSDIEAIKGGLSDAMKRAAYQFGIGRYLYDLPEGIAETRTDKPPRDEAHAWNFAKAQIGKSKDEWLNYWWQPPRLPDWALPPELREKRPEPPAEPPAKEKAPTNAEMGAAITAKKQESTKRADAFLARMEELDADGLLDLPKFEEIEQGADALRRDGKIDDIDYRRLMVGILDKRIAAADCEDAVDQAESMFLTVRKAGWLMPARAAEFEKRLESKRASLGEGAPL